jgi:hypothetical protein
MGNSQIWKSIIRSGVPKTRRQRMHAILGSVFLHLHPARLPKHAVKIGYTWCMGGGQDVDEGKRCLKLHAFFVVWFWVLQSE